MKCWGRLYVKFRLVVVFEHALRGLVTRLPGHPGGGRTFRRPDIVPRYVFYLPSPDA